MPRPRFAAGARLPSVAYWLRRIRGSRLVGQAALYAGASALTSVLAGVAQIILARELSPDAFGSLAFATAFLLFAAMFFEFGLFLPAARRIAGSEGDEGREVTGAALVLYAPLSVAFALLTFGASFVVDGLFHMQAGDAMRVAALVSFFYPFVLPGLYLSQGADRLHVTSISSAAGQAAFLAALAVLVAAGATLTTTSALLLRSGGYALAGVMTIIWLRPLFRRIAEHARTLIADARAWGFSVYVGRVLSVGSFNMDVLMLGAFADAKSVGYYALAGSIVNFLGWPVTGLATALFPRMTGEDRIDERWLAAGWTLGTIAVVGVWALGGPVVDAVFGDDYSKVAGLLVPLMLAQAIRGVTAVYNSFLGAHARGRELRNTGIVLTVSNVVLNFALIPPFGATGAAWASLAALVANYVAYVVSYRRVLRAGPVPST